MRDYRETSQLLERIIHKYNQIESRKMCYGGNIELSRKEIHTINFIGLYAGVNVTQLAKLQGVTKGAVSQMVYKLVDKGFVDKRVSPNSDTEVSLFLTDSGKAAFDAHNEFHRTTHAEFFQMMDKLPDEVFRQMTDILINFDKSLDKK